MKRFAGAAVVLGVLGLGTAFVLWWLPADDYLIVPDRAKPLADKVEVDVLEQVERALADVCGVGAHRLGTKRRQAGSVSPRAAESCSFQAVVGSGACGVLTNVVSSP